VPPGRWILAGTLLLAEYLLLSVALSADALRQRSGWWSSLGSIDPLGAIALAAAAAALLIGGSRAKPNGSGATTLPPPALAPRLAWHALAFGLFAACSTQVLGEPFASTPNPGAWMAAWTVLAGAVFLSAAALTLRPGSLLPALRRFHRPLFLGAAVGLVAWAAGRATTELWLELGRITFAGVVLVLRLAGQTVVDHSDQLEIGIDDYVVHIAASCAGYEGFGLMVVFLGAFLWIERHRLRFPRAYLLLPIGIAAVLGANIVRIAALIGLGRWVSPQIAEGSFHSKAGWVLYCGIALGIAAAARRSRFLTRHAVPADGETWNPAATYLLALLALIATVLVTGLVAGDFDDLYPLRPLAVVAVLWAYRDSFPLRIARPSWESVALGVFVFAMWMMLEPPPDMQRVTAWKEHLEAMPAIARYAWLLCRVAGSVITVPIAEELAFRGYLVRRLIARDFTEVRAATFTWPSFLLSSVAFGAMHQRWIAGTIAGMCFALAQLRGGRLEDAVVAHAIANALIAVTVLSLGSWSLWM
jgi:exosortase E/protease (VPEID-CTERM system)